MKERNQLWYGAAGLVLVCILFLLPPWTTGKVILGIVPLLFLVVVAIQLYRAGKRGAEDDLGDESDE